MRRLPGWPLQAPDGWHRPLSLQQNTRIRPGKRTVNETDLGATSVIFNRSHHIGVTITSSIAPRFDPNPNAWPGKANAAPVVAHQRIRLGGPEASCIVLPAAFGAGDRGREAAVMASAAWKAPG